MKINMSQHTAWIISGVLQKITPDVVRVNNEILVNSGQGDGETKWKGWAWKLLLVIFVILLSLKFFTKDKDLN